MVFCFITFHSIQITKSPLISGQTMHCHLNLRADNALTYRMSVSYVSDFLLLQLSILKKYIAKSRGCFCKVCVKLTCKIKLLLKLTQHTVILFSVKEIPMQITSKNCVWHGLYLVRRITVVFMLQVYVLCAKMPIKLSCYSQWPNSKFNMEYLHHRYDTYMTTPFSVFWRQIIIFPQCAFQKMSNADLDKLPICVIRT